MNSKWLKEYDYLKKSILEDKKSYEEIGVHRRKLRM